MASKKMQTYLVALQLFLVLSLVSLAYAQSTTPTTSDPPQDASTTTTSTTSDLPQDANTTTTPSTSDPPQDVNTTTLSTDPALTLDSTSNPNEENNTDTTVDATTTAVPTALPQPELTNNIERNDSTSTTTIPPQSTTVPINLQITIPPPTVTDPSQEISWEEKSYYLPQAIQIVGQASGSLISDQVVIHFNVETLDNSASISLNKNNEIIQNTVNILLDGILQPTEIATEGVNIFKQGRYNYNNETNQWDYVFEGYKVNNRIKIVTDKIEAAGFIIDTAVENGINQIDYVQFLPLASSIKELQDSLISQAVTDATNKAHLALFPLGYEVASVKNVNIVENGLGQYLSYKYNTNDSVQDRSLLNDTPLFQNTQQFIVSVKVEFLIKKTIGVFDIPIDP